MKSRPLLAPIARGPEHAGSVVRFAKGGIMTLLAVSALVAGRAAPVAIATREIDAVFAPWDKPGSPGAALAIIHEGRIVYERGYGRADIARDIPVTPETSFYVGSVSKQFTAAAIALLALRGTISLEDDVRKYVPEVPDYGKPISLRHLIHHTSGLRDYLALRDIAGEAPEATFDENYVLSLLSRQQALNFAPGSEHLYSNSGYFLLSLIVKRTTGQSLRTFSAQNIFQPLGMASAQFRDDHTMPVKNRAEGYAPKSDGTGYRVSNPNFDVVGAGGVFMTVRDFLAWDENFYSAKVGGRPWVEQLQTSGTLNDGRSHGYAFGLMIGSYRGLRTVEHSGAYGGFRAHVLRFPAQRFSVVCFTNLSTMVPGQLARRIATICLGEALSAPASAETPSPTPPATVALADAGRSTPKPVAGFKPDDFVGSYVSAELQVTYRIVSSANGLALQRGNRPSVPMEWTATDAFRAGPISLVFRRNPRGEAAAFIVDAGRVRGLVFSR